MSQAGLTSLSASNPSNPVIPWPPNQTITWVDDFLPNSSNANDFGQLLWVDVSTNIDDLNAISGHPGIIIFGTGGGGNAYLCLGNPPATTLPIMLGSGSWELNYVMKLQTLSTVGIPYTVYVGLMDNLVVGAAPNNGVYLSYTDSANSGKWTLKCTTANVTTTIDTGITASTAWVNVGFTINATASSVTANINGVPVGTAIITNIPTAAILSPAVNFVNGATNQLLDLFYMRFIATTAR